MIQVAIVEDEPSYTGRLKDYFARYEQKTGEKFRISEFRNGLDFITNYSAEYDVVFMDIEMPLMNGMEAAKKLRKLDEAVTLVFVTNAAQYAVAGYAVDAMDYIVKPVDYFAFANKLDKVVRKLARKDRWFCIPSEMGMARVYVSDIYYIEGLGHHVIFHTSQGVMQVRSSLKSIEEKFADENFVRCSSSFLVNLAHVSKIMQRDVFVAGDVLPVSRSKRKNFIDSLTAYLGGRTVNG